jgi:peptide-methionine (R)-S-oxide reductase
LSNKDYPLKKSDSEWREELDDKRYHILREKGTERPFSGEYNLHFEKGTYTCGACNIPLFRSDQKFESGCGWPSFDDALDGAVSNVLDKSHGMIRTEIVCSNCGSHLGHVFNDGPTDTGQRYCVNSLSVDFKK